MSVRNTGIQIFKDFSFMRVFSNKCSLVSCGSESAVSNVTFRSFASASALSRVTERKNKLPDVVYKNLEKLKVEVVQSLLDKSTLAVHYSDHLQSPATDFTQNFRKMAKYYFTQGGKLFRPTIALLVAYACNQLKSSQWEAKQSHVCEYVNLNQYRIAIISEMIHTASLVHDDVVDESDVRRGNPTANALWGNQMAVLVGDFILARATQILCSIGRPNVISVMALIIEDIVKGEFLQMSSGGEKSGTIHFDEYMEKTYLKTASLFANSCKSAAMLADISEETEKVAFEYGRSLGLAFQLVDDMLDFVSTSETIGKPAANDLNLGLATAPVLFAVEEHPELNELISRRFSLEGDVANAWKMVLDSKGIQKTQSLAKQHAQQAANMAKQLSNDDGVRNLLTELAFSQLDRKK